MYTCGGGDFYSNRYLVKQRKIVLVAKHIWKKIYYVLIERQDLSIFNRQSSIVDCQS